MPTSYRLAVITPDLALTYKAIRLRALQENPEAFCATYARESAFPDAVWLERSTHDHNHRIAFIALDAATEAPIGLIGCFRHDTDATTANVIAMWVAPTHRGSGVADSLLHAITHWAQSRGFTTLRLDVVSNNTRAIALYQRHGFTLTGFSGPHANDLTLHNLEMARPLPHSV